MNPLRLQRILKGLTQLELGKQAGIPNNKLCMVERGYKTLKPEEIKKLSQILDVPPEKLL